MAHNPFVDTISDLEEHPMPRDTFTHDDRKVLNDIHEMLCEIKEFIDPLKALANGLGPMQKMGMSPAAKAALERMK